MFCSKCGTKAIEGADFCQKCGTKLIKDHEVATPLTSLEAKESSTHTRQQLNDSIPYVELTVTCVKVKGVFPGTVFPLLVDEVPVGDLPSNGTFTCRITPGPHRVKVGRVSIGINIPKDETAISLHLQYSNNKTFEFICSRNDIITEPSAIEQATLQTMLRDLNAISIVGVVLIILATIGFIIGAMIPIDYPTMDYVQSILVGAFLLLVAAAVFLILSPKTRKRKAKGIILGLLSIVAIGSVIVIASSTMSFINWNRMIYVNAVKNTRPFDTAENRRYWSDVSLFSYPFSTPSYDTVFNHYIDEIEWITVNRDAGSVDVTGRLTETNEPITVHFNTNHVMPYEIVLDDVSFTDGGEISTFLWNMFDAYVNGDKYPNTSDAEQTPPAQVNTNGEDPSVSEVQKAYADKVRELAAEDSGLQFDLIDLTGDGTLELVADCTGYYISIFAWRDGEIVPLGEEYWPYGAMGNNGYEYLPGQNVIRNFNSDQAGAILYESYYSINFANEIETLLKEQLSIWYFRDANGNGCPDDNEPFLDTPIYYVGSSEVSEDIYSRYQIPGDYRWISGDKSAEEMIAVLDGQKDGSYGEETSTASNTAGTEAEMVDQVLFCGIPIQEVIGMDSSNVVANFGEFDNWIDDYMQYRIHGYEGFSYFDDGWVEFTMAEYSVAAFSTDPLNLTYNGQNLAQDFNALVTILGDSYIFQGDTTTSWWAAWYSDGYEISFEFLKDTGELAPNVPFSVFVSPIT